MKIIAIAAVTAGGKTTVVNEFKKRLPSVKTLHFDDYTFEGEADDYYQWTLDGANYNVWDLSPLLRDVLEAKKSGQYDYLLLDYPFAYCHDQLAKLIECAVFIDTPLDIAMARRVLRDMKEATGDEIRSDMEMYLKYARVAYVQMLKDILPSSDYVLDGTKDPGELAEEIIEIINNLKVS